MPNGSKHWVFTLNNYSEDELAAIEAAGTEGVESEGIGIAYLIVGKECGESGTDHLQGYVCFRSRRTMQSVKNLLGSRLHLETKKGSPKQASEYCKKEGNYKEFGRVPGGKGSRTDLQSVLQAIKGGMSERELLEQYTTAFAKYPKFVGRAMSIYATPRNWMPVTRVYWGGTGTGKTRRAFEEAQSVPYVHSGGMWFDGYDGQEDVIFDDFCGSEFKLTYLLRLLDRYPMRVPVKGAFVNWCPKRIWITANYSLGDWYAGAREEHRLALKRRVSIIVQFRRLNSESVCDTIESVETINGEGL